MPSYFWHCSWRAGYKTLSTPGFRSAVSPGVLRGWICFTWSGEVVRFYSRRQTGWPPCSMLDKNDGWISRNGRLLCFASISMRNGEGSCHSTGSWGESWLPSGEVRSTQRSKVWRRVGRCHWYKYFSDGTTMAGPNLWLEKEDLLKDTIFSLVSKDHKPRRKPECMCYMHSMNSLSKGGIQHVLIWFMAI